MFFFSVQFSWRGRFNRNEKWKALLRKTRLSHQVIKKKSFSRLVLSYRTSQSRFIYQRDSTSNTVSCLVTLEVRSARNLPKYPSLEHFSTHPDRTVSQKQGQYRPCMCTPSILSLREMYSAYHNDATSLNDAHSHHRSRFAALARGRLRCSGVSIGVPEDCPLSLVRLHVYRPPIVTSSPSSFCRSWYSNIYTIWRRSEINWHACVYLVSLYKRNRVRKVRSLTCNSTEHNASRKTCRRIDLIRFITTWWHPRL